MSNNTQEKRVATPSKKNSAGMCVYIACVHVLMHVQPYMYMYVILYTLCALWGGGCAYTVHVVMLGLFTINCILTHILR